MSIKVYKASAGSGKTYTLVYEYIKFLFNAQFNNAQCTTSGLELKRKMHNAQLLTPSAHWARPPKTGGQYVGH